MQNDSVAYTKHDAVTRQINEYCKDSKTPVGNLLAPEYMNGLVDLLVDNISEHKQVTSVC